MKFSHVFLQIKVSTKPFAAYLTRERLLIIVGVHMKGEIVDLVKSFATDMTLEWLYSSVSETVVLIVAFLVETFPADVADERFVSSVNAHVRVERGRTIERLATLLALVRLLLSVDNLVST